jgi:predicted PolB exonuclease-like 3'-5' exonuclease
MPDKLYTDIETAPVVQFFKELPELGQMAFMKKFKNDPNVKKFEEERHTLASPHEASELVWQVVWEEKASLHAEFSRVISVSIAAIINEDGSKPMEKASIAAKVFVGPEAYILAQFKASVVKFDSANTAHLCAHNGNEFDFPYLMKRFIINGIEPPQVLKCVFMKSWDREYRLEDTAQYWKFGAYKDYNSLITLCFALEVPSPKNGLDGSKVMAAWFEGKINEIAEYNIDDSIALVNVDRKLRMLPMIETVSQRKIIKPEPEPKPAA